MKVGLILPITHLRLFLFIPFKLAFYFTNRSVFLSLLYITEIVYTPLGKF